MKIKHYIYATVLCTAFTGCQSSKYGKEVMLAPSHELELLEKTVLPQSYGMQIVRVRNGITYMGSARVHPNHMAALDLLEKGVPAVKVRGSASAASANALMDISSPNSWIEAKTSTEMKAKVLGINEMVMPYRGGLNTGGANAYAAVISRLRFNKFYIENVPIYIRMAKGSLGPQARGITDPDIHMVVGYDCIRNFEYIQYDLASNKIRLSASIEYEPMKDRLLTTATISKSSRFGCAVEGAIYGQPTTIILDPAGDYTFARADYTGAVTKQISIGDVVVRNIQTFPLPSAAAPPRIGRRVLENYLVTVCPRKGVVYFERPTNTIKRDENDPGYTVSKKDSTPPEGRSIRDVR
ncbi:MAG: hypothetical protein K9M45_11680 [Kiritimatiellales bacterium]|nr:hypothetical protein [Kiritimatiellales bacterium]